MSIVSIFIDTAAQIGVNPRIVRIISTDNLATVTTAGYLNPTVRLEASSILPTDEIHMWYGYTSSISPGTFEIFTPSISNGVITLSANLNANVVVTNGINTMASGSEIILAKSTATTTAGAATVNQQSGVLTTPSITTAGGSSYVITLTNSLITTSSVLLTSYMGGTNTTTNLSISAVPGAGSATITIYNDTAATAFNGTVIVGFVVV